MNSKPIAVARNFSRFPAGRFRTDGNYSGQAFREGLLLPALMATGPAGIVTVQLDGTLGYGSSFLEEAFGGLVRVHGLTAESLKKRLQLESVDANLKAEIRRYIDDAQAAQK